MWGGKRHSHSGTKFTLEHVSDLLSRNKLVFLCKTVLTFICGNFPLSLVNIYVLYAGDVVGDHVRQKQ